MRGAGFESVSMSRAVQEVMELTLCSEAKARRSLEQNNWHLSSAVNSILVESTASPPRSSMGAGSRGGFEGDLARALRNGKHSSMDDAMEARALARALAASRDERPVEFGDGAATDAAMAEAMAKSLGSGMSVAEEEEMVRQLQAHTDASPSEARRALEAHAWHAGRAAESLVPELLYLSPKMAEQRAREKRLRESGALDESEAVVRRLKERETQGHKRVL